MSEEESFHLLQREFHNRLKDCANAKGRDVLRILDSCLSDLVAVGRSAIPNANNSYEAPVIMTVLACITTLGEAVREEMRR